ncbi:MAG: hypothetical protein Q7L55_00170 [Actinomycetota bacterium]|nr:hypothetical protein [Actinomycetota bacterium]
MRRSFNANAVHIQGYWAITIHGVLNSTIHTQAKRIDRIEYMARDAIALGLQVQPDSFDVTVSFKIDPQLQASIDQAKTASRTAQDAQLQATSKTKSAVELLHEQGFSTRDAGALIGLSPQRISQLLAK